MATNKQPVTPRAGINASSPGSNEDPGAMIPKARLEVLIAMGRAFPPVVTAMSLSLLVAIGLSGYLVHRDLNRAPQYFTTDARGRAVAMKALDEPTMSRDQVSQYVIDSLVTAMSMDYKNFKDTQNAASTNFTPGAFNELVKSLTDQGIYEAMEKRKLVLRAVATGAPRVVGEGQARADQPYAWVVQAPFVWTFSSAQRDQSFSYVIQAVVTRQPTSERENGVAISAVTITQGVEKL